METVSSPFTVAGKWLVPVAWIGFWASMGLVGIVKSTPVIVTGCVVTLLAGYPVLSWRRSFADEVVDYGNYLRVTRGSVCEQIDLLRIAEVVSLPAAGLGSPSILLKLHTPCAFGKQIRFFLRLDFLSKTLSPGADFANDLRQRIAGERRKMEPGLAAVRRAGTDAVRGNRH